MLINLSNHPSSTWDVEQLAATARYGEVVDMEFPPISPDWNAQEVFALADVYCTRCLSMIGEHTGLNAVHIAGELSFCFYLIQKLLAHDVTVLTSTTERIATIDEKGIKKSKFHFVQFREFINLA